MRKKGIKIIIDTNLWISYLISKDYNKLDKLIFDSQIQILFCEELYYEIISVTSRPKLNKYFEFNDLIRLFDLFNSYGKFINVSSSVELCRDIKDNFLLVLAKDGEADYLISGDKDLLDLKQFENTLILSISDFLSIIK